MLYQIINGTVSMRGECILEHFDFEIKGKEKIAIVGANGAGKTTLLRLLAGEIELDSDDKRMNPGIRQSRKLTVGMLHQIGACDSEKTVEELMLEGCPQMDEFSRERFYHEMEFDRLFTGFGFEKVQKKKKFCEFSGGEQTKILMLRLFLQKPDLLLLDEPTNHLDLQTVEWLEQYMKKYDRAVVFVSHDRFFLDQVVDVVYEVQRKKLKRYVGNYTQYRKQKIKDLELARKAYERQQEELARLGALVEKFKHKPKKAAFARSRKTMMERMPKVEKPEDTEAHIFAGEIIPEVLGSKWVFEAEHLKIGYDKVLLELSLRVKRGQKIGIIGDNGVGKSTFLKTITGELPALDGKAFLGNNILFGYFDQHTAEIDSDQKVIEHFQELFPGINDKEARQTLGNYLFRGPDTAKRVKDLSGGEKSRLMLCELLTGKPNLLLLDEPTNHMDIQAKETLESIFQAYKGTMLFVSHDRYFVNQVADALLVFEGEKVMYYPFGYEHYSKRRSQSEGEDIAAMVRAEDQALVADLRAVPDREKHRLREISTEEAYLDWKLRLAAEPVEEAQYLVQRAWENWNAQRYLVDPMGEDGKDVMEQLKKVEEELEDAWKKWTQECLKWYDTYLEEIFL